MTKQLVAITLDKKDYMQIIDGLTSRAEAWEKTARLLDGEEVDDGFFLAEECSKAEEANWLGQYHREIIDKIKQQLPTNY